MEPGGVQGFEVTRQIGGREWRRRVARGLVDLSEAAAILRVSVRTVQRMAERGELHSLRRRGGRPLFRVTDLVRAGARRAASAWVRKGGEGHGTPDEG